jgi:hypothetical protein
MPACAAARLCLPTGEKGDKKTSGGFCTWIENTLSEETAQKEFIRFIYKSM